MLNVIRDWLVRYAKQGVIYNDERMLDLCEPCPGAVVIDLGCGDGTFTARVGEKAEAARLIGVDIAPENLAVLIDKGIEAKQADLNQKFPVDDESVDIVIANQVIEHVCGTDIFVQEMFRILKRGGHAIVATPNLAAWYNVLMLALGQQPPSTNVSDIAPLGLMERRVWAGRYVGGVGHKTSNKHRRIFVRSTLVGLFEYYGFRCEKLVMSGFPPLPWFAVDLACRLLPMYAWNIIIKVRKPV